MKDKLDRVNKYDLEKELESRMRLLKLDNRLISHLKEGKLFYSYVNEVLPLTEEMKEIVKRFSKDAYVPYHIVYSESSTSGRLLYVLSVSLDKADWKQEREQLGKSLEIPCDIIFLDKETHESGSVLLTSIAEDAFLMSERRPIVVASGKRFDFLPDLRTTWLSMKHFFDNRCS